jgi:hypothetical protein
MMQPPAIECYLVTDEAVLGEGEPPKVVCTSEPEDYAWFNGIDPAKLLKTDTVSELATECVEGHRREGYPSGSASNVRTERSTTDAGITLAHTAQSADTFKILENL